MEDYYMDGFNDGYDSSSKKNRYRFTNDHITSSDDYGYSHKNKGHEPPQSNSDWASYKSGFREGVYRRHISEMLDEEGY